MAEFVWCYTEDGVVWPVSSMWDEPVIQSWAEHQPQMIFFFAGEI